MSSVYVNKSTEANIQTKTVYEVVRTRSLSASQDHHIGGTDRKSDVVAICSDYASAQAVLQSILATEARGDDERAKMAQAVEAQNRNYATAGCADVATAGLQGSRYPR